MAMGPCCSVNLNTIIALVILQGAAVVLFYEWYASISPRHSASPDGKVHVLLLSSWRSGSSFLGQVFSQHPSVFYLMEPAWHVWTKNPKSSAGALRVAVRDLLWSLYKCDYSLMKSYQPENPSLSNLFMWTQSRALCSPPACPVKSANESHCRQMCHSRTLKKAEESCQTHTHVVLKETRFFELESLYPLLQDPNLDLRVVHLVRDPRAVIRSREASAYGLNTGSTIVLEQRNVSAAERQYEVIQEVCRSHLNIYERGIFNPPPFLEDRYKLVRYEDIVRNPTTELNDIYEFVGLQMTSEVEEWIHKMTHGKGNGGSNGAFQITSRNATKVSQAWRTVLQHNTVKRIQKVCKGAMLLLGYRTVDSEEEQKRLDIDLLVPVEP
ncbi:carbohydrate sulfotransferase 5-like [Fundulus heteroclitus]|uniref:carbohydrate sulfotransferase 5-like n=1 Tax=Fundulus heteroclitus TaxID=8078 RepID=UPI00165A75A7|nr:carbohydrate sulfotransferase 5-like [Fundulus heteroclitus]